MLEMISFYMEAYSIFGTLIIAMVTIILNTFMYRLNKFALLLGEAQLCLPYVC